MCRRSEYDLYARTTSTPARTNSKPARSLQPDDQLAVNGATFVVQGEPERRDPDGYALHVVPPRPGETRHAATAIPMTGQPPRAGRRGGPHG